MQRNMEKFSRADLSGERQEYGPNSKARDKREGHRGKWEGLLLYLGQLEVNGIIQSTGNRDGLVHTLQVQFEHLCIPAYLYHLIQIHQIGSVAAKHFGNAT